MNHWGENDRNHEYQDSNNSASIPDSFKALLIGNFTYQNKDMKMKKWSSQWTQFMQLRKEAWKNSGFQRGLNPWPRDTGAMLY